MASPRGSEPEEAYRWGGVGGSGERGRAGRAGGGGVSKVWLTGCRRLGEMFRAGRSLSRSGRGWSECSCAEGARNGKHQAGTGLGRPHWPREGRARLGGPRGRGGQGSPCTQ